jgi:hypothetical protein
MKTFKQWLLEVFGQPDPPLQNPEKLNNGAFPRYSLTIDDPIVNLLKSKKHKKSPSISR